MDHFQVHHIDDNPQNNELENLLLLCPLCHSKITKADILPDEVKEKKNALKTKGKSVTSGKVVNFNALVENAVVGDNNKVTINVKKAKKNKYPEGCVSYDVIQANYIGYLIDRYHEYKEYELGKESMNYAIFPSNLKKKFKIGRTRTIYHVPTTRFGELVLYIQSRIDRTMLAKVNKGKGQQKNYELFDEYVRSNT